MQTKFTLRLDEELIEFGKRAARNRDSLLSASSWRAQRRREMDIRLALGARRSDILALSLADGLVAAALGIAIGLAAAIPASGLLSSLLFPGCSLMTRPASDGQLDGRDTVLQGPEPLPDQEVNQAALGEQREEPHRYP